MSTYTKIIYHIVYATKYRKPVLTKEIRENLFNYVWGLLKKKGCHLYRINAADDHMHLLLDLSPKLALADLVKDLKIATGIWLKTEGGMSGFEGWQDGYGAFTLSPAEFDPVKLYIAGQDEHHRQFNFRDELRALLGQFGLEPFEEDPNLQ